MNREIFTNVLSYDAPAIDFLKNPDDPFSLHFDYINERGNIYLFKFRFIIPKSNNESIKIKHGYSFEVKEKSIMNKPSKELTDFFAQLILKSIEESNKKIKGGRIQIKMDLLMSITEKAIIATLN